MSPCIHTSQPAGKRAFTLIELLTVIAIIGILASILIPTVSRVRDSARAGQCLSNMRQVTIAMRMYAEDNRGNLPMVFAPAGGWSVQLSRYFPAGNFVGARSPVLICPSNDYESKSTGALPVAQTYAMGPGSAGLNDNAFPNDSNGGTVRTLSSITNPSMAIWLMESHIQDLVNKSAYGVIQKSQLGKLAAGDPTGFVALRHGGNARTNLAFADGSVRSSTSSDFTTRYPDVTTTLGWRKAAGR